VTLVKIVLQDQVLNVYTTANATSYSLINYKIKLNSISGVLSSSGFRSELGRYGNANVEKADIIVNKIDAALADSTLTLDGADLVAQQTFTIAREIYLAVTVAFPFWAYL
jgi:hypothetical protein